MYILLLIGVGAALLYGVGIILVHCVQITEAGRLYDTKGDGKFYPVHGHIAFVRSKGPVSPMRFYKIEIPQSGGYPYIHAFTIHHNDPRRDTNLYDASYDPGACVDLIDGMAQVLIGCRPEREKIVPAIDAINEALRATQYAHILEARIMYQLDDTHCVTVVYNDCGRRDTWVEEMKDDTFSIPDDEFVPEALLMR